MSKIKIFIVDDHQLFRGGIISLLSNDEDIEVTGECSSADELFELLETKEAPDIVLIDISMDGMDGLEVIQKSKKKYPNIRFIVLTMHEDGQYIVKAVRNGAYGYLLKNADKSELREAIKSVYFEKKYFNKEISQLMVGNIALEGDSHKKLSERETEILHLVSEGKTTKEIASQLFVSTRTVETHRVNMMKKLHVQNTAELITKAVKLKLI